MLGTLIDSLDDPDVAAGVVEALDEPILARRLDAVAETQGLPVADLMASTVRSFMETASDDLFVQLMGIMSRAEDPGLAALRAILLKALPETAT
ncbi:MAG: hypothetical protein ACHQAY_18005 [Hyphomicrobiales bacterium]